MNLRHPSWLAAFALTTGSFAVGAADARALHPAGTEVATVTGLASSPNPALFGVPVTFTATVTTVVGGSPVNDGLVTFTIDGIVHTAVAVGGDGVATHSAGTLGPGSHTVRADYSGVQNAFDPSTGSLSQQIDLRPTTTTLTPSVDSARFGEPVTFTASVSDSASGGPVSGGSVTFSILGATAATQPVAGGTAALTTDTLPIGGSAITALYNPVAGGVFQGSEATIEFSVNAPATVTTVASSNNPSQIGHSVTFTATVTSGGNPVTNGSVTFLVGPDELGTVAVGNGVATISTTQLVVGQHEITAGYSGSNLFSSSVGSIVQEVTALPTITTLESSSNPSDAGEEVTFTARVFYNGTVPVGPVSFLVGGTPWGTVDLNSNGVAVFMTSGLDPGSHLITAAYEGAADFSASSAELTQQVDGPVATSTMPSGTSSTTTPGTSTPSTSSPSSSTSEPTTPTSEPTTPTSTSTTTTPAPTTSTLPPGTEGTSTELTSSVNPSRVGQAVTFTIEVSPSGEGGPVGFRRPAASPPFDGGSVTISDGDVELAVVALEDGRASATISSLAAGTHTITAAFSGTATAAPSSDTIIQEVDGEDELPATR
jgi:large repetitive protein